MRISWRVALLSAAFILMTEIFVLMPAVGYYRTVKLQELVDDTALIVDSPLTAQSGVLTDAQAQFLAETLGVYNITLRIDDREEQVLTTSENHPIDAGTTNLIEDGLISKLFSGPRCIISRSSDTMRLIGQPERSNYIIDLAVPEQPICQDVRRFSRDLFVLSVWLCVFAAFLLFIITNFNLAAPILKLTRSITRFDTSSRDRGQIVQPTSKVHEIYEAESSLRDMQERVIAAMEQRDKLVALGESVSKIQHDLRNMLSTASLNADRLEFSEDPKVRQSAPRLKRALDRAIALSSQTVEYGALGNRKIQLKELVIGEVCQEIIDEEKLLVSDLPYKWILSCPKGLRIKTDEEYFIRVYRNLIRNARQILDEGTGDHIITRVSLLENGIAIQIEDDGPGMSEDARAHLFQPFKGSSRKGGSGLGLALSHELCVLMGGDLRLVKSDSSGTIFEIYLPKNPMIGLAKAASTS